MKRISTINFLLVVILIISSQFTVFSQGQDSINVKKRKFFIGIIAGPVQTVIFNEEVAPVSEILSNKKNSYFSSLEFGYYFAKNIGLVTGIGYTAYRTQVTLDAYQNKYNTIDSEKESYQRQVFGTNIVEVQKIGFISVPICLNIRLPLSKTIGIFLQSGVNFAFPLSKKYSSSGTFTYKGYYSAYNVLLENLPFYGFPNSKFTLSEGQLELNQFNIFGTATLGFDFFVQQKVQIVFAACYNKSLSNISAYTSPDNFRLSTEVDQVNSFMRGSNNIAAQSFGISIGFRYYFE